jgi:hypothetical protein
MRDEFNDTKVWRLYTVAAALAFAAMLLLTSGCATGSSTYGARASVSVSGPVGYVRTLPPNARVVVVNGRSYRVYRGTYYSWDLRRRVWVIKR